MSDARAVAAGVLERVWTDEAYAAAALSHALEQTSLAARDAGLCTELCYGVLRTENYLSRRIEAFGKLGTDPTVRSHLLVATYQLDFLDRIPARAAVHEAVRLVREQCGERRASFANAVLRRVAESSVEEAFSFSDAVLANTPSWLRKRISRVVGEAGCAALLVPEQAPGLGLRLRKGARLPTWETASLSAIPDLPRGYRYTGGGDPRRHPSYRAGHFTIQEAGAQWVAHALGAVPGDRVLDVCAGRGQKTTLLLEELELGPTSRIVATDVHRRKLDALEAECRRLGLAENQGAELKTVAHDWQTPPRAEWMGAFDRVLVDAPCTGTGTLRRRPEILRRIQPNDPERMAALQTEILANAARALAPGGRLIFATCSVLAEEGEQVLERIAAQLEPCPFGNSAVEAVFPPHATTVRLLPGSHGSDGYFVACLRARS